MTEVTDRPPRRLLLVEDDAVTRDTVRIALDRYGCAIRRVGGARRRPARGRRDHVALHGAGSRAATMTFPYGSAKGRDRPDAPSRSSHPPAYAVTPQVPAGPPHIGPVQDAQGAGWPPY
ncbi:hypothetical protein [Streptomyces sp. NPDC054849]